MAVASNIKRADGTTGVFLYTHDYSMCLITFKTEIVGMNQGVYDIFKFKGKYIAVLGYNIDPKDQSITELVYVFQAKKNPKDEIVLESEDYFIAAISSEYKTSFVGMYIYQTGNPAKNNALIISSDNIRSYKASPSGTKLK